MSSALIGAEPAAQHATRVNTEGCFRPAVGAGGSAVAAGPTVNRGPAIIGGLTGIGVGVIGELYEHALAGWIRPVVERADGSRMPLPVDGWRHESPADQSILNRCQGPTLDIGSGPGRLTVALAERGIPTLGIDITPYAVDLARSSGALVMLRDVFGRVPGTGRWMTVLLADGNIGIGGDPAALLRRAGELLAPAGRALVELGPPGTPLRREHVRLRHAELISPWFPWAFVGTDHIEEVARDAGLGEVETWTAGGRWFAAISSCPMSAERIVVTGVKEC